MSKSRVPNVLTIGAGEYITGLTRNPNNQSDKKIGVVGVTMFDLRDRGLVGDLFMAARDGSKFSAIRKHLDDKVGKVYGLDTSFRAFPREGIINEKAYLRAMDELQPGDAVTAFTPDHLHFDIAMAAVERGLHVMLAKPTVKSLEQLRKLNAAAESKGVLVLTDFHKRGDYAFRNARGRLRNMGGFGYFQSYMSQPLHQLLSTFKDWAGKIDPETGYANNISAYLNAHLIDFHSWMMEGRGRPVTVRAVGTRGLATSHGIDTEDTISLQTEWELFSGTGRIGTANYTASWTATPSDRHTHQGFRCDMDNGTVICDQGNKGLTIAQRGSAEEAGSFGSVNSYFMNYVPGPDGKFDGQHGYGYTSFSDWISAVTQINNSGKTPADFSNRLPVIGKTFQTMAILEAGDRSLMNKGRPVEILYRSMSERPVGFRLQGF